MESENVFKAAEDGKLDELKNILNYKSKDELIALVSTIRNGETPLVIASKNGHLDVVTYLLEECHADVEQDGEILTKDAPLIWSAANGHLNILKELINYKQSANRVINLDYLLMIACRNGNLKVAEYLIEQGANIELPDNGDTCLRITCLNRHYKLSKYLLECGADVNIKNKEGVTPLHACVSSGNLKLIKLLLQHGAVMNTDGNGWTPLVYAALRSYDTIVEYFIEEYNYTTQEKVIALELLGATFVDEDEDMITARECWKVATELRNKGSELPLEKPTYISPLSTYVYTTEVRTCDQLDGLNDEEMEIQALLVRERILGPGNSLSLYCVRNRAIFSAENAHFHRSIRLWMYTFDTEADQAEELNYYTLFSFIYVFHKAVAQSKETESIFPAASFCDLLLAFKCAVRRIQTALNMTLDPENGIMRFDNHDVFVVVVYLVNLMCKLQPNLNRNEVKSMEKTIYKFVHLNPKRKNGFTLLHVASCSDSSLIITEDVPWLPVFLPEFKFPSRKAVDLLLKVGACPNALDSSKNTSLHVAAMNRPFDKNVFQSLLNKGAHLDFRNSKNETPLQLVPDANLLDIYPLQHLNLQCLCAQAIRKHKIAYKYLLHQNLYAFVDSHGSY